MGMGVLNFWLSIDNWHQAKNPLLSDDKFSKDISVQPELQWIIWINWYSISWDQIVLFVFGIWSICNLQMIFKYPNSCYQIPNTGSKKSKVKNYRAITQLENAF